MTVPLKRQIAALTLRPAPTTMRGAGEVLDEWGSENDPIFYRGEETTIQDLSYAIDGDPAKVWIEFFGIVDGGIKRRSGTVLSMIVDRIIQKIAPTSWRPTTKTCTKCGQEVKK